MNTDTVLYDIYNELGLLEALQSDDVQDFVEEELELQSPYSSDSKASA